MISRHQSLSCSASTSNRTSLVQKTRVTSLSNSGVTNGLLFKAEKFKKARRRRVRKMQKKKLLRRGGRLLWKACAGVRSPDIIKISSLWIRLVMLRPLMMNSLQKNL